MNRELIGRWLAEVAGTALLVGIGTGTVVAAGRSGGIPQDLMAAAWFVAVLAPILLFVEISGAHLNPVVTLALALSRRFEWKLVPGYWVSQFAGAFVASGLVLVTMGRGTYLGATVPSQGQLLAGFAGEATFTALLVACVFLLADHGPGRLRWRFLLPPLAVGLSTYVIGPLTGSSLNPARTVSPAVLSGTYTDLGLYLTVVPLASVAVAIAWGRRPFTTSARRAGAASEPP